jgi:hypothetical protein
MSDVRKARFVGGLLAAILGVAPAMAAVAPNRAADPIAAKEFRHPELLIQNDVQRIEQLSADQRGSVLDKAAELRVSSPFAYVDPRTGRFATLMPVEPLVPGTGEGNTLAWADLSVEAPASASDWQQAAWSAFSAYVERHAGALGIDPAEMGTPNVTVHDDGALIQIHTPRVVNNVPVRDSHLTAVINHGNLVLFGAANWGTVSTDATPSFSAAEAGRVLGEFVQSAASSFRRKASLAFVPMSAGPLESLRQLDRGLQYRLVWVLSPQFAGNLGTWEALVDAHSGELLAFSDTNQYQSARRVQGGVFPVSNDGLGPSGTEQAGWPFPYADVATSGGNFFTDTGGNLPVCATGNITSTLNGTYVRINDTCGPISLAAPGNIDFGTSAGTNCTTPGIGGAGNTHASRTGFFELNKLIEQARGQLPNNAWLQRQLTANMNINLTCNAFWNGATVNFYHAAGACNNLGEIAAVFDHEWGHGMDNNDTTGTVSNPGEGIADIYMALRLNSSCVGRNAFVSGNCSGYGDACLSCTGFREMDFAQLTSNTPMTITRMLSLCPASGSLGPCARETHCEGQIYGQVLWDLMKRDLPAAGFSTDTALEIATRLAYLGSSPVTTVYQCVQGNGGCPATAAYLNYLAADDDNGNITTGTPHFAAIRAAFDRHGIACSTPVAANTGCPNAPTAAPVVTTTAVDKGARLSWASVPNAVKYRVYRTEGVFGCNFGKVLLGETFGTTWADDGLQNGRQYSYTVAAVGLSNTCLGPMSTCANVTPVAGTSISVNTTGLTATQVVGVGDNDTYVDNCETWQVAVPVSNTGTAAANNVRIASVQFLSHPGMTTVGSPTQTNLATCASGTVNFSFKAVDLQPDDPIRVRVSLTSDEMSPAVKTVDLTVPNSTEGNNQFVASQTFDFESSAEGWARVTGTYNRTNAAPGGAGGANTFYWQSSSGLDAQCDEVQSPIVSLTTTSTLSLQNNFQIEPFSAGSWYDRANLGIVQLNGTRTVVTPSGGRAYNASGPGGVCGLDQQAGWADAQPTWGASTWTAAALQSPTFANQPVRLNIKYGTDPAANGFGFRFDQVTLTDFNQKIADAQTNQCTVGNLPPVANPDNSNSLTFGAVTIGVLANDTEPNGQCMRVSAVTTPANGTAVINSVGCPNTDTVTYIPSPSCGIPCNDSFQYTVSDQNGGTATATVTINQVPVQLQQFRVE